jgi:hypothetical protein
MDKYERQELIDKLQADNDATSIDMAERRARIELHGEDEWQLPQEQQRQSHEMVVKDYHQQPAPRQSPMPPEAQRDWDAWCDARIRNALFAHETAMIEGATSLIIEENRKLQDRISSLETEVTLLRAIMKGDIQPLNRKTHAA